MRNRKYLPTLGELIDRLSIVQIKEVLIPEHKEEYAQEIKDIVYDIDTVLQGDPEDILDSVNLTAEDIRKIVVLAEYNLHIWHNEAIYRQEGNGGNLELTHNLNGIRNLAKNKLQEVVGGRTDLKIDCLAADMEIWRPSGW